MMDTIKEIIPIDKIKGPLADKLRAGGFVNKEGQVCLTFVPPGGAGMGSGPTPPPKTVLDSDVKGKGFGGNVDPEEHAAYLKKLIADYHLNEDYKRFEHEELPESPKASAQKLKRMLRDNDTKRPELFRKSGDLDHKRVTRLGFTDRIFMRKNVETDKKNYVVHLLLDTSGSMHSTDRGRVASITAANIARDLMGVAKIGLYTHTDRLHKVKGADDPMTPKLCVEYFRLLCALWHKGGGNRFSVVLKKMAEIIKEHPDKTAKHIVIMFSDGGDDGDKADCKRALKELERVAEFELVAMLSSQITGDERKNAITHLTTILRESLGQTPPFMDNLGEIYEFVTRKLARKLMRRM